MNNIIDDIRTCDDFKKLSFSKYKKRDIIKRLNESLIESKLENSLYWCAEMICSGYFIELWDAIIIFFSQHIYSANPKLPIYINNRINSFKMIINQYNNQLELRNNDVVRKLFTELITILCLSNKKMPLSPVFFDKNNDFTISSLSTKLKAKEKYVNDIIHENDPNELELPINELYNAIKNSNGFDACYWVEWMINYTEHCSKKKQHCKINERKIEGIKNTYKTDPIWMVWDTIIEYTHNNKLTIQNKIILSLYDIFKLRFKSSYKKSRRLVIYYAIYILVEKIDFTSSIYNNSEKNTIDIILTKSDDIYKKFMIVKPPPSNNSVVTKTQKLLDMFDTVDKDFIKK